MKIDVHIRKNETGEIRVYHEDHDWQDNEEWSVDDAIRWIYGKGNYSCDCNRELFFEEVEGKDLGDDEIHCSDGRFTILKITDRETGEVIAENL